MPLDLLLLAVLSAFWPTLVLVDVLAFQTKRPEQILIGFLLGGLLTTVTIGSLLVVSLQGTSIGSASTSSTTSAVLDLVISGFAFLAAYVLSRTPERAKKAPSPRQQKRSEMTKNAMERGAPLAFVGGILLNIVPGLFPIIAIKDLATSGYSTSQVIATMFVFYVIMFAFVEAPIVGYVFAGDWTGTQVTRFNAWLNANHRRVAIWALVVGGCYLLARAVYATVT